MSIIGIDIGTSTTKFISYENDKIVYKKIFRKSYTKQVLQEFIEENNIANIEKIVFTGIGANKVSNDDYNFPIYKVGEFEAIAKGGLYLANKENAIVVSVGTGTALVKSTSKEIKHLGGTGVGAGTLFNFCNRFLNINSFDDIYNFAQNGNIERIDLRIGDVTDEEIKTLPKDLTLSNFGKFQEDAGKEDIVVGIINMVFEVIGMMAAFYVSNSEIKEAIVIGNITVLPGVKEILKKIEKTQNIKFIVPKNSEFGVVIGAIKSVS